MVNIKDSNQKEIAAAMDAVKDKGILVIGDMVADIYLDGRISRISREAPVLVLDYAAEKIVAGGAANVVNNVATLGGRAFAAGIVGLDKEAKGLKEILERNGVVTEGLITDEKRFTISKTRIVAGGRATVSQQIVRIDKESRERINAVDEQKIIDYTEKIFSEVGGAVLSDYGSGTITNKVKDYLTEKCRAQNKPLIVDSRYDIRRFKGVSYIKQNDAELAAAVGREFADEDDLREAGKSLLKDMEARGLLLTRGERGMTLFLDNGEIFDIPVSDRSEVYDVSGAGDTCVAAFILTLTAGISPARAATLSNIAAGIAVRKLGTATVSGEEVKNYRRAVALC